jgi:hypothetical protein
VANALHVVISPHDVPGPLRRTEPPSQDAERPLDQERLLAVEQIEPVRLAVLQTIQSLPDRHRSGALARRQNPSMMAV